MDGRLAFKAKIMWRPVLLFATSSEWKVIFYAFFCKVQRIYLGNTCKKVVFQLCYLRVKLGSDSKLPLISKIVPKCNITHITAQKRRRTDANHISSCFYKLLESFDTIYIQQYQNGMKLGPENPHFGPPKYPKCNISQITAHKLPKTDVNHISACFYN